MNDTKKLTELIHIFIENPDDPVANFNLAIFYEQHGQLASAVSYYLRTAERTNHTPLVYESIVRAAICFDKQGTRNYTVKGMLQHSVALEPTRPEGYYLLSRYYERKEEWSESYMISSIAEKVCNYNQESLHTYVDYPGEYGILFQKAVSSWWCGLCDESRGILMHLRYNYKMDDGHRQAVDYNLNRLGIGGKTIVNYTKHEYNNLKYKFSGSEDIESNYSESYQDLFVLSVLDGKKDGTYLEIGSGHPFYGNNTALLEKDFGWSGISLDFDQGFINQFIEKRSNTALLRDATKLDYIELLDSLGYGTTIDYLQVDCDPPEISYEILSKIPFEKIKFAIITFEHDSYVAGDSIKEKSRKLLKSFGYELIFDNVSFDGENSYEDWWIHPKLVDKERFEKMKIVDGKVKSGKSCVVNCNT
jgi:hypothetical protein